MMKTGTGIILALVLVLISSLAYADECNSVRYSDNNDGTVTDCRTGLTWLKNAHCTDASNGVTPSPDVTWYDAIKWAAGLHYGLCGLTDGSYAGDWRLPTKTEWMAMVASALKQAFTNPVLTNGAGTAKWSAGNIFDNVQSVFYWSSTTVAANPGYAWDVYLGDGDMTAYSKTFYDYVWPVRGGQSGTFGNLILQ
jgi:hypothetical protein